MNIIEKRKDGNEVKRKNNSLDLYLTRPKEKKRERKRKQEFYEKKKKANSYNRFVKQIEPVIRNERLYEFRYREICSFFPIKKKKKRERLLTMAIKRKAGRKTGGKVRIRRG